MQVKKAIVGSVAAGGIGLASLGLGAGVASAAPPQQHQQQQVQQQQRQSPMPVQRPDHRPFDYRGHRVTPVFDQQRHGWGFWFFGIWVPLAR